MDEPWQIYYEEFRFRAEDVAERTYGRADDMAEAAHDAYESTADLLVSDLDYEEEEALALAKAFARGVGKWIDEGGADWEDLRERLEIQQQEWELMGDVPV